MRPWIIPMTLLFAVSSCASNGNNTESNQSGGCASSCESNDWDNITLGIVAPVDGTKALEIVGMEAVDANGRHWPGTPRGGLSSGSVIYSHTWATTPSDKTMTINVWFANGETLTTELLLAPHNYCARNIAYIELYVGTPPYFGVQRYISPCSGL